MSKPARRVIGIIRIKEASEFGVVLPAALDDSTLGSLLAGLVGKQAGDRAQPRRSRFQCAAPTLPRCGFRSVVCNLHRLREDLEREYLELAAR
jgi:hypothetical protein